ncbi:hypothetical protein [Paeniglutamicibacter terrestris]|uniref:Uncharacterized protein n=1 Tax=Paeniglutamicibacter terrestris TaxID=2723403 RepID=A0ABX1G9U9_9MICC|nr:hypothetical protein [Paeniglutamicibacter terrestris]NKG22310.1 hypothetical protein [Paeniglutamicibacter terrestris]
MEAGYLSADRLCLRHFRRTRCAGIPDLIGDGVLIISRTRAKQVLNLETTTTYGQNDMALGNVSSNTPAASGS